MQSFPIETVFVATGPDFTAEALDLGAGTEQALADLLREYGPERLYLYVQNTDGHLRPCLSTTAHTGRDDIAKYYLTTFSDMLEHREIQIGWDS